jgi:hypothetical protein
MALVGKMCSAGSLAIIYNYTVEIFPTVVRSSGTSFGSMSGRIGSMLAPLLHNLVSLLSILQHHLKTSDLDIVDFDISLLPAN